MLNKVLPINQLQNNIRSQLRQIGDFYVCSHFTEDVMGDPVVKIDQNVYYRFMDYFYLPQPPESLTTEQVIQLCDLRLEHLDKLVNRKLNECVVSGLVQAIRPDFNAPTATIKALDFGCGSGLSTSLLQEHMSNLNIVGVDISAKAIAQSRKQGLQVRLTYPDAALPFEDASFDVIFAVFVMHFKIDIATLSELIVYCAGMGNLLLTSTNAILMASINASSKQVSIHSKSMTT
jgi:SAM-dependent methyltransferase